MYAILRLTHVHSTRADVDYLCTYVQVRGTSAMYLVPRTVYEVERRLVQGTRYVVRTMDLYSRPLPFSWSRSRLSVESGYIYTYLVPGSYILHKVYTYITLL